jgi:hypothetical protein
MALRLRRGSRSRGHEADNRRQRNCSTARQCATGTVARNRVARIRNYKVLRIGNKVARSKVVHIGNRVARIRIGNEVARSKVVHIGNRVARSKIVRIGDRAARIGNYSVLRIGNYSVLRIGNYSVLRIGNYSVDQSRTPARASEADISNCRALSWCRSRRHSHWLYRQRARLSL